jgi:hypothetical protein
MKLIEGEKYICITDNFYPIGEIVVYEKSFVDSDDNSIFGDNSLMLYKDYLRIQKIERILGNE